MANSMVVTRILPDCDFKEEILHLQEKYNLTAGIVICAVGSLKEARLRMSNGKIKHFIGPLEIVSIQGTISAEGIHIHMAVSDETGQVFGGHLKEGCIIYTTSELCVLNHDGKFKRRMDFKTGFKELIID